MLRIDTHSPHSTHGCVAYRTAVLNVSCCRVVGDIVGRPRLSESGMTFVWSLPKMSPNQKPQFWDVGRSWTARAMAVRVIACALGCVVVYASGCSAPVAHRTAGVWAGDGGSSAAVAFLPEGSSAVSASEEYWARQSDQSRRDAALLAAGSGYEPYGMWPQDDVPTVERPYYINTWRSSESYLIFRRGTYESRGEFRGWSGSR